MRCALVAGSRANSVFTFAVIVVSSIPSPAVRVVRVAVHAVARTPQVKMAAAVTSSLLFMSSPPLVDRCHLSGRPAKKLRSRRSSAAANQEQENQDRYRNADQPQEQPTDLAALFIES